MLGVESDVLRKIPHGELGGMVKDEASMDEEGKRLQSLKAQGIPGTQRELSGHKLSSKTSHTGQGQGSKPGGKPPPSTKIVNEAKG